MTCCDCSTQPNAVQEALAFVPGWCYNRAAMFTLFPLHPRFVHFPIALLMTGSLLAIVYLLGWRRPALPTLIWGMLGLGWLALFPVVLTGLIDQNQAEVTAAAAPTLNQHIAAGFGLIIVYGLALYERLRAPAVLDDPRRRLWLSALLGVGMLLIVVAGALGGELVFTHGLGRRG